MLNFNSVENQSGSEKSGGLSRDLGKAPVIPLAQPKLAPLPQSAYPGQSFADHAATAKRVRTEEIADYVERRRGMGCTTGCLRMLLSCRCLTLAFIALVVGLAIGMYLIFTQKPSFIYEPLKEWLNAGLVAEAAKPQNNFEELLLGQIQTFRVGDNKLVITEEQLRGWVSARLASTNLKDVNVTLEPGKIKLYWNAETDPKRPPLWLLVEMSTDEAGQPIISKTGTERVGLPPFLNQILQQLVVTVASPGNSEAGILGALFPLPNTVAIKKLNILADKVEVTVNIKSGLEGIF